MTVQCAILNPRCEIFASDTRVTTPEGKKYDGVQKIFEISNDPPAKIMINGNMEFENIPIETIINEFKSKTNFEELKTIEEIKNEFLKFTHNYAPKSDFEEYISYVVEDFKEALSLEIEENGFDKIISTKKRKEPYPFIRKYSKFNDEFCEIIPKKKEKEKYNEILWEIFSQELKYSGTGIIIAGYNPDSPYPSFFELNIHCNDEKEIIYEELESKIDFQETIIRIYAMNQEGYSFFTGFNEEFLEYIRGYINETNDEIIHRLKSKLHQENITPVEKILTITTHILNEEYSDLNNEVNIFRINAIEDTSKSIEFIPNNLLCTLADEIIRLTGIKQKISSEEEYVSIKSHISLITKPQGFKWVKLDKDIV